MKYRTKAKPTTTEQTTQTPAPAGTPGQLELLRAAREQVATIRSAQTPMAAGYHLVFLERHLDDLWRALGGR